MENVDNQNNEITQSYIRFTDTPECEFRSENSYDNKFPPNRRTIVIRSTGDDTNRVIQESRRDETQQGNTTSDELKEQFNREGESMETIDYGYILYDLPIKEHTKYWTKKALIFEKKGTKWMASRLTHISIILLSDEYKPTDEILMECKVLQRLLMKSDLTEDYFKIITKINKLLDDNVTSDFNFERHQLYQKAKLLCAIADRGVRERYVANEINNIKKLLKEYKPKNKMERVIADKICSYIIGPTSFGYEFKRVAGLLETEDDKMRKIESDKYQKEVLSEITRMATDSIAAIGSSISILIVNKSLLFIIGASSTLFFSLINILIRTSLIRNKWIEDDLGRDSAFYKILFVYITQIIIGLIISAMVLNSI